MSIEEIRKIRTAENLKLKPSPYFKTHYQDEYGEWQEVALRNYQKQGVMNLLQVERMCLADDTGLGKSIEILSTLAYIWMVEPEYIPVIITNKSALFQWEGEINKFMQNMIPVTVAGDPIQRRKTYEDFFNNWNKKDKKLLILTYDMLMKDIDPGVVSDFVYDDLGKKLKHPDGKPVRANKIRPGIINHINRLKQAHPEVKFLLTMDEAHKIKNYKSKFHQVVAALAKECQRVYGLTATPIKNRLMEFFSLFKIIQPGLFPKVTYFMNDYCVTKLQPIGGGRRVPIIVGYKNLDKFVQKIEPFYLSRKKHEVAKELPELVTREIKCELTGVQQELYELAEAGALVKGSDPDASHADILASLTACQQAVNSPALILNEDGEPTEGDSIKEDVLIELLQNELDGVKTIIFSRFEKMISRIGEILEDEGIKYARITGKENKSKDREQAKQTFQNPNSGIDIILITTAGSESINLQAAEHILFVDAPWSFGDLLQIIGRMIRIGSQHKSVVVTHLVAYKQDGKPTIDGHVLKLLRRKKSLADKVAGNNLVGGLQFSEKDDAKDILNAIKENKDPTLLEQAKAKLKNNQIFSKKKNEPPKKPEKKIYEENDPGVQSDVNFNFADI
jgi:SNF2 family DNA or RNA helicase